MHWLRSLVAVPTPALLLVAQCPGSLALLEPDKWPYDFSADYKYWPENGHPVRRDLDAVSKGCPMPQAVRKMGVDEGEKFFMEYWGLGDNSILQSQRQALLDRKIDSAGTSDLRPRSERDDQHSQYANGSMPLPYKAPFVLHTDDQSPLENRSRRSFSYIPAALRSRSLRAAISILQKRDFKCPTDTVACTGIDRPYSCCATGETCAIISDTGLGDVGCCQAGENGCAGDINTCDTGFTKCPSSLGGGCCIPDYDCVGVGCALSSTSTTTTVTSRSSTTSTSTTSGGATLAAVPPPRSLPCTDGFRSCPASLGGGCCATDRDCASGTRCPARETAASTSTTLEAPNAPVRPTGDASATETSADVLGVGCPTGFYQCNAFYRGGCCRVGRDCGLTSCPASALSTVKNANGVVIVAPTGEGAGAATTTAAAGGAAAAAVPTEDNAADGTKVAPITSTTDTAAAGTASGAAASTSSVGGGGTCASGWLPCPASDNGGCCPSGFACASVSCRATGGGATGAVGKIAQSAAMAMVAPPAAAAAALSVIATGLGILLSWV